MCVCVCVGVFLGGGLCIVKGMGLLTLALLYPVRYDDMIVSGKLAPFFGQGYLESSSNALGM